MQITIYTQPSCPYCDAAKTLLDWNEISYVEINVTSTTKHPHDTTELFKDSPLPKIFINDEHIGSYQQLVEFISQGKYNSEI
ncbi:MAG: glutaredoxin [Gammaproteobacteria bacterium]|nr:MAG: glutaredoxin [Gammaproteobacteria bacterium]